MEHRGEQEQAYTPESVEADMRQWQALRSAAEGGTGALGGGGNGKGRTTITVTIADLERAADALPLHWLATAYVFQMQERGAAWLQRMQAAGGVGQVYQQDVPLEVAFDHMARSLGWQPTSI